MHSSGVEALAAQRPRPVGGALARAKKAGNVGLLFIGEHDRAGRDPVLRQMHPGRQVEIPVAAQEGEAQGLAADHVEHLARNRAYASEAQRVADLPDPLVVGTERFAGSESLPKSVADRGGYIEPGANAGSGRDVVQSPDT